ncbi:glycine--tRNA ligase subunit beta [Dongia soli]|uniref:Glycine--tRNA ligase beta subunit n=1 Tax=Dongia soli TaxID=600628 RepID=A0ABU5ECA2_9PROT|nr:glycine--tRNA ligase subunit beta [Dongia soli]MDY0883506.1 glycine--tRNA ligase subunit beta [Dongia soli]
MAELLLEIFSEEIPARMQARAAEDLKRLVTEKLKSAGLAFKRADAYVTPRRLALVVDGLPVTQADVKEEKKGPRVGSPQQAVDGFLKSAGLASLDQCEERDTGKGVFYFAVIEKKGAATAAVLPGTILDSMAALPWPKSMRWADYTQRWVRPLHGIIALFDGKVLEGKFDLGGSAVTFDRVTRGHRFLSQGEITVSNFAGYQAKLRAAKVILDQAERRASIKRQADELAAKQGLEVKADDGLLDEVTGLVEWPVVLMGGIDQQFMSVPAEVLTTSMRTHQKYFAVESKDGKLAPHFLVVANIEASDGGAQIIAGNERVLRARLSDAEFFWSQDQKVKLADRVGSLGSITYHAKLGSVGQKVARNIDLAGELAKDIGADIDLAKQAARLAKADLVSGMVGEFPELQGIMGRYYAQLEKLPDAVADAIADHYKPLGPTDTCPNAPVSIAVALADKIDTLTGFFAIDEKPTGSKDPFALRRAALGIIRLIIENKLRLKLRDVLARAYSGYYDNGGSKDGGFEKNQPKAVIAELMEFFADRLKVALKEQGTRHDLISAVFALGNEDDLVRLLARVDALKAFVESEDGANLLTAYKRASNIVRIEEKKDGVSHDGMIDAALLEQMEEKELQIALASAAGQAEQAIIKEDYASAMSALAHLRRPVDAFFDKVTVNCDDPQKRINRLRLLSAIRSTLNKVADFSKIEG